MNFMVIKNNQYRKSYGLEFCIDFKNIYVNIKLGTIIWRLEWQK